LLHRHRQAELVDAQDIVTGKAQYAGHARGMLLCGGARGRRLRRQGERAVDDRAFAKVPGVVTVVQIDPTPGAPGSIRRRCRDRAQHLGAMQGRNALKIEWDDGPNASYDSVAYRAALEEAARKPGPVVRNDGDFAKGAAAAAKRITAEYYLPHVAHATMEPPAASARIAKGKCEVWGCFQSPQAARDLAAKRLGMKVEDVTVHVTLLGGGWPQVKPDFGVEAAVLSKAMDGSGQGRLDARRRSAQRLLPHGIC
jgi:isoquinoline 1-oxidoreductase beta subunit